MLTRFLFVPFVLYFLRVPVFFLEHKEHKVLHEEHKEDTIRIYRN